jgi:nucleoside-diphosphate-sugar epimerase
VATGESFLVSGSQPVTWVDYYRALEGVLGSAGAVETLPLEDLLDRRAASSGQSDSTIEYPDDHFLAELRFPAAVDITRARSALGYRPAFDLAAGMEATRQWAQWAGIAAR